jgi:PmbA protein
MRIDSSLAEKILEEARKKGALCEAYVRLKKGISTEAKGGELENVKTSTDFGYSVRVIKDSRTGFSYSTDPALSMETLDKAIESAKFTEEDPNFALPAPGGAPQRPDICDPQVEGIGAKEAFEKALIIECAARESDKRIKNVRSATASFGTEEILIANTLGIRESYISTAAVAQIMAVAEEGGDTQMGFDFMGSAYLGEIDFRRVGAEAARRALLLLGAKKTGAFKGPVVLDNSIAAEFLAVFASMLSAESVQKGKSLLAGKTGAEVINPMLDIIDDGLLPRELGTRPVDDEGVAASRKVLIEQGVLKGFMHNTYTAKKEGARSTGNAVKPGIAGSPTVGPLNLYLAPSRAGKAVKAEKLFKGVDKGLYVLEAMGMHTANPISGEFSIGVTGLLIEGGKLSHSVKEAVISGNILALFEKVQAIGDDLKFFGSTGSPSILLGPIDISA